MTAIIKLTLLPYVVWEVYVITVYTYMYAAGERGKMHYAGIIISSLSPVLPVPSVLL